MKTRLRLVACLGTLVALVASRDNANTAQKETPSNVSTALLYTDGTIIRMAQDDWNEPEPRAKRRSSV
ncbi:MAG: hypothetical protein ACM3MH_11600 [Actinomycetota bacterium]|jgi:hypothetical protein